MPDFASLFFFLLSSSSSSSSSLFLFLRFRSNISLGDMWLKGMADGAGGSNRTVQYCMPYANEILSAAAYPAVSNARVRPTRPETFYWPRPFLLKPPSPACLVPCATCGML